MSLSCDASTSAKCLKASLPPLPRSSRAPCTSEPSRCLISSASLARGRHHHVLDLAVLHPTAAHLSSTVSLCGSLFTPCGASSGTSAPASLCWVALTLFTTFSNTPYLSACCWLCSFIMGPEDVDLGHTNLSVNSWTCSGKSCNRLLIPGAAFAGHGLSITQQTRQETKLLISIRFGVSPSFHSSEKPSSWQKPLRDDTAGVEHFCSVYMFFFDGDIHVLQ